jgi:hypothetical protein
MGENKKKSDANKAIIRLGLGNRKIENFEKN